LGEKLISFSPFIIQKKYSKNIIVLLTTFFLTVFDLTIAFKVGLVLAMFLFIKKMTEIENVAFTTNSFQNKADENDPESIKMKDVAAIDATGLTSLRDL